jgi:capsular polysaccharide biosynthesis protein
MTSNEFSPHEYFFRVIKFWWIVLLATFMGGALGFIFFHVHPPIYEATATYFVTLDLNHFPKLGVREDLIQYNEDMALNTTEGALVSTEVVNSVIIQIKNMGQSLSVKDLLDNSTIERKHDIWELRYRGQVPSVAQSIVNTWAEIGYQAMLSWQASGKAPNYVIFQSPTLALVPQRPVLYGRSNLMLAGALIGFIAGIIISTLLRPASRKTLQ